MAEICGFGSVYGIPAGNSDIAFPSWQCLIGTRRRSGSELSVSAKDGTSYGNITDETSSWVTAAYRFAVEKVDEFTRPHAHAAHVDGECRNDTATWLYTNKKA